MYILLAAPIKEVIPEVGKSSLHIPELREARREGEREFTCTCELETDT